MKTAVGVMAEAPLPGLCKARLLAAHSAEWVTALSAAMLRDTLDGLQAVPADDYIVFVEAPSELAFEVLMRHVPSPWRLVAQCGDDPGARSEHALATMFEGGATYALLSGADAPSFPTDPLTAAMADHAPCSEILVGPREDGGTYVIGMPRLEPRLLRDIPWDTPAVAETIRLRCRELGLSLRELPKAYDVDEPPDVLLLLDEMRRHPERAPRTAQFLIKNA